MKATLNGLSSLLLALVAAPCHGQTPPRSALADSSVPRIMAEASTRFPRDVIVEVLRQKTGNQPEAKRQELADSVIALAIRSRDAIAVVGAIGEAGYPDGGTPDARALEWLIRIHREARDGGTQGAALRQMLRQINASRALPYFFELAVARDGSARAGMIELIRFVRSPELGTDAERADVLARLRRMWDQRLVPDAMAMVLLRDLAAQHRWGPPRGT